jgi:hypothetical protein
MARMCLNEGSGFELNCLPVPHRRRDVGHAALARLRRSSPRCSRFPFGGRRLTAFPPVSAIVAASLPVSAGRWAAPGARTSSRRGASLPNHDVDFDASVGGSPALRAVCPSRRGRGLSPGSWCTKWATDPFAVTRRIDATSHDPVTAVTDVRYPHEFESQRFSGPSSPMSSREPTRRWPPTSQRRSRDPNLAPMNDRARGPITDHRKHCRTPAIAHRLPF